MQSTPVAGGAAASIVCGGMGGANLITLVINSITVTPLPTSASPSPSPTPSPTSTVDLVQGKNAAVLVTVRSSLDPVANDQTPVIVKATLPGGSYGTSSPIPMASISSSGTQVTIVPIEVIAGSGNITITVSASDAQSGSAAVPVRVKQTSPLGIVYVPFTDVNCTGENPPANCVGYVRNPGLHRSNSDTFIQDTFPVANGQVTSSLVLSTSSTSSLGGSLGVLADILTVALTSTISNATSRNGVGIVPSDLNGGSLSGYFSYHYPGDQTRGATLGPVIPGATVFTLGASLVEEGWWPVTAHEVAHTFGVPDNSVSSLITNAYDVVNKIPLPINSKGENVIYDFMGPSTTDTYFQNVSNAWISPSAYRTIFYNDLVNPLDPQVLVLSGIISQDGIVTLNPTYFLNSGYATPYSAQANGVVNSVDSVGTILSQSSFLDASQLELFTDDGRSLPLSETPFLVQIPFSQNIDSLQIVQTGKAVSIISPSSQLLVDVVKEIPTSSFIRNAAIEQRELLTEATLIQDALKLCEKITSDINHDNFLKIACSDSVEELVLSLRRLVNNELNDSTAVSNPLQLTKTQALTAIDAITLQLLGSPIIQPGKGEFTVMILPPESEGILSISSVTQGAYGSVAINKDGTLSYKPDSSQPKQDSFVVTVKDIEGTTVSETVAVTESCTGDSTIAHWANRFNSLR